MLLLLTAAGFGLVISPLPTKFITSHLVVENTVLDSSTSYSVYHDAYIGS